MARAWKARWVQALGGSNPPFSASNSLDLEPVLVLLSGEFFLSFESGPVVRRTMPTFELPEES